ncbi:vacuolar amino acid transporter 1 [Elysia marginata]|uniref:Vacuolar amino acid transporter 1 n=1 Tax=Elysia marginata TaxID=1093978 RepID=A0AAV4FLF9_9GAST|nr:vacuolar amino acid transporter 1 [Elysia marginata]
MPVVISGFLLYGDNLQANVLLNITAGPLLTVAQILITLHLMAGAVILINPLCQESEDLLGIPPRFWLEACFVEDGNDGISALHGIDLAKVWRHLVFDWELTLHEKVACVEIILVGTLAGSAATYSAVVSLFFDSDVATPCYVR